MNNALSGAPDAPMDAAPAAMNNGPSGQPGAEMPQIDPADIQDHIDHVNYMLPLVSKLARDPKVTRKDVVKALSGAMADKHFTAQEAVEVLSRVPQSPEQLKPWLKEKLHHLIIGGVHLNAMNHAMNPAPAGAAPAAPMGAPNAS